MKRLHWAVNFAKVWWFECQFFAKIANFKNGLILFNFDWNAWWNKDGYHSPNFRISLTLINIMIFEFDLYNATNDDL